MTKNDNETSGTDDNGVCTNQHWRVDFFIPSGMFPSGLNKVLLKSTQSEEANIRFW